jgi:Holliday junction resolvasome RuvABC endonuclease subunit
MTAFVGIDWSLTATGVVVWSEGEWDRCTIRTTADDGTESAFLRRVHKIAAEIIAWADPREGDVIAIEGPSLGAKGAAVDRMFGGWHITMDDLIQHHGEPWVFAPSSVKKLATGKGNAGKDEVLLATAKRLPEADVTTNHEADAAWLAIAASIIHGQPILQLPTNHTSGLTRILKGKS